MASGIRASLRRALATTLALSFVTLPVPLPVRAAELPELPRVSVDTAMPTVTGQTITVPAGGSLQSAVDSAQPGDEIVLEAGATYGAVMLRTKSGSGWIIIRSSRANELPVGTRVTPADAPKMARVLGGAGASAAVQTENGANHYRFIGIEFTVSPGAFSTGLVRFGTASETSLDQLPHHLILDRCYVHGDASAGGRRGVMLASGEAAVIDSYFSDWKGIGQDTQAIAGWSGPGPYKIENNYLEGAGENVMFGGADPKIAGVVPSDIEIRRNHFFKPLAWRSEGWVIKNIFELKNARRVLVAGNLFENNWAAGQNGTAILLSVRNQEGTAPWTAVQDITFTNNIVRHVAAAVKITGFDDTGNVSEQTKRVLFRNNVFDDINSATWGGQGRMFLLLYGPDSVTIDHNTGFPDGAFIYADNSRPFTNFVITNNITTRGTYGVRADSNTEGVTTLTNVFPGVVFSRNALIGADAALYPADNFFPASVADVGFVDYSAGNYRLAATSVYATSATDGGAIGADLGAIDAAMAAPGTGTGTGTGTGGGTGTGTDSGTGTGSGGTTTPTALTLSFASPATGTTVSGNYPVAMTAAGGSGTGYTYTLKIDGTTVSTGPASYTWDTTKAANGLHTVSASVTDSVSGSAEAVPVTVTVQNTAPAVTVAFTNPASGATVSGTVTVTATASGGSGTGYTYTVKAGTNTIYTGANTSFSWNTTGTPNGAVTLTATATDSVGASGSATRDVTVSNPTSGTSGATLYVSPTGSDSNPGSITAPLATPGRALELAKQGDTIYLRAGRYTITRSLLVNQANLTVASYPGERAAIVGGTTDLNNLTALVFVYASGVTIADLELQGGSYYGIKLDDLNGPQTGQKITGNYIHHTGRDGIKGQRADGVLIENNEIAFTGVRDASNAEGIDVLGSLGATVRGNYIHDTATSGLYLKGGTVGGVVEKNLVMNTGAAGILLGEETATQFMRNGETHEAVDSVARNNIVVNAATAGIGTWGGRNVRFENNTIVNAARTAQGAFLVRPNLVGTPADQVLFKNNIVVLDTASARPLVELYEYSGVLVSDSNIWFSPNASYQFCRESAAGGRTCSTTLADWQQAMNVDGKSRAVDPRLDATDNLYVPFADSPAVDAGETLAEVKDDYADVLRPQGAAYDIGAHETVKTLPLTVSLSSPAAGTTVSGTTTVTMAASGGSGTGYSYVLKIDGATVSTGPASYAWDTTKAANGSHTLTATVTDSAGASANSTAVTVTVQNVAPVTVAFTSPVSGATVTGSVLVVVSATGGNGSGYTYTVKAGSTTIYTGSNSSFTWNTTGTPNGAVTLTATATDAANRSGSATQSVTVSNTTSSTPDTTAPTVSITKPSNGAWTGNSIGVAATATDDKALKHIELWGAGKVFATLPCSGTSCSGSYQWITGELEEGAYQINAVAVDAAGNRTISATVTIYKDAKSPTIASGAIDITPPKVKITKPSNGAWTGNSINVAASATDDKALKHIELWGAGKVFATLPCSGTSCSGSFQWITGTLPKGAYQINAVAIDSAGNRTVSATVTIYKDAKSPTFASGATTSTSTTSTSTTDITLPTVAITSPSEGAWTGNSLNVAASATDETALLDIRLYGNTVLFATIPCTGKSCSGSAWWSTGSLPSGKHTLMAVARDLAGNTKSTSITINK